MANYTNYNQSGSYMRHAAPGLGHVGSYQVSGYPWITSSVLSTSVASGSVARFNFPGVAKRVKVQVMRNRDSAGISHDSASHSAFDLFGNTSCAPLFVFFGNQPNGQPYVSGKDVFNTMENDPPNTPTFSPPTTLEYSKQLALGHCWQVFLGSGSIDLDVKTNHINVACLSLGAVATSSFQILAEVTSIHPNRMFELTGSGIDE